MPEPSDRPPLVRRLLRPWPLTLVVAGLLVVGGFVARTLRGREVAVARADTREVVASLVVNGRVLALSRASLGSPRAGRVAQVHVREGDRVRQGDELVRLEGREESAAIAEARAEVARADARLASLRGPAARIAAEAREQAEVELALAERELARREALGRDGVIASADLDQARRARDLAASRARAAAIDERSKATGGSEERLAQAELARARAALAAAETRLAETRVLAPADGVVLARNAEPGDVVPAGRVLVELQLLSETLLLAQPDEKNLGQLAVGQRAFASADAFAERSFAAEVLSIAPNVDPDRGTIDVRLRVPAPPPELRTDMTLSIDIETGRKAAALVVPLAAVRDAARAEPFVLLVERGRAIARPIRLGLVGGDIAEVVSGLAPGDVVVLDAKVAAGDRVRAKVPPRSAPQGGA